MPSPSPLLLLAPLAAFAPQEPSAARPDVARVHVHEGRAVVTSGRGEALTLRASEERLVGGPAHVEVAPGTQVRLSWAGRASLEIYGPAALQWDLAPGGDEPDPGSLATWSSRGLVWRFFDAAWIDVEVRRGRHFLHLPGDWRAECAHGAWHVRGLASGPLELHCYAGEPTELFYEGHDAAARPPLWLYPGSAVRLDRLPRAQRLDDEREHEAWADPAWPWRSESDSPAQRAQRDRQATETDELPGLPTRDPAADGPRATIRGVPDRGDLRVELRPRAPRGPAQARRAPAAGAPPPSAEERVPEPTRAPSPAPILPPAASPEPAGPRAYQAAQWRGLAHGELDVVGVMAVEDRPWSEVRIFPSGRSKVLVDEGAKAGIWAFSPTRDYWLAPGSIAMFDHAGELVLRHGDVRDCEPIEGRPAYAELAR